MDDTLCTCGQPHNEEFHRDGAFWCSFECWERADMDDQLSDAAYDLRRDLDLMMDCG